MLAPLAFFAAATVLVLLVNSSLNAGGSGSETTGADGTAASPTGETVITVGDRPRRRFYRVRPGDTLTSIADRFDTTVPDLLDLNPRIEDPLSLTPGQRIRVR